MPDPKKEQIAADLVQDLQAILVANGYHTDAGANVSRRRRALGEMDGAQLPALFVVAGDEGAPQLTHGSDPCLETEAEFLVVGYVSGNTPDVELLKLDADVKRAVLSNRDRGGSALDTMLNGSATDYG